MIIHTKAVTIHMPVMIIRKSAVPCVQTDWHTHAKAGVYVHVSRQTDTPMPRQANTFIPSVHAGAFGFFIALGYPCMRALLPSGAFGVFIALGYGSE